MRDKAALHLNTKKHSVFSIVSFVLAILSLVLFVIAVIISAFYSSGSDSHMMRIGMIEIISMMCTLSGLIFGGIGEFMVEDIRIFSHIALPIHVLLVISHIMVLATAY